MPFTTKNDIPERTRVIITELLAGRLADAVEMQAQTKQAHWNVKGPGFIALHELFDRVHDDVVGYVELFGERVVQLGGYADGGIRTAAKRFSLPEFPRVTSVRDKVDALSTALAAFGQSVRSAIDAAEEAHDRVTAGHPHGGRSCGMDQWLGGVEGHVYDDSSRR
jgi:starvation-inducible DNA-binding protein